VPLSVRKASGFPAEGKEPEAAPQSGGAATLCIKADGKPEAFRTECGQAAKSEGQAQKVRPKIGRACDYQLVSIIR